MTDRRTAREARAAGTEIHTAANASHTMADAAHTASHADRHAEQVERTGMKLMRLMMVAAALSFMSVHAFNIVVPEISRQFGITLAQATWLSSGYTLLYGFGAVVWGKLADRFALRPLITAGLLGFAAGSLTGLLSQSFWAALAGRLLQAAGASVVPAMAMILPIRYFAPERRASAISMTAVGLAIGGALGPVVSALLLAAGNWRWLFVPSLLMLALLPPFRKRLAGSEPASGARPGTFDAAGGGLLLAATAALLLGFTYWNGWFFAAFAVATALFVLHIRRAQEPFVRPGLFRNRAYRTGLLLTVLGAAASNGLLLLSPMLLADVYRLESKWIGFALVPAAFASAVLGRRGGKLADRRGNLFVYTIAAGLIILCFTLLSLLSGTLPAWGIPLVLLIGNVGLTFVQVALTNSLSGTLPKTEAGIGMGLVSMTNFLAIAVSGSLYGFVVEAGREVLAPGLDPDSGVFSMIYAALAALYIVLLVIYRMQFGAEARRERSVAG